MLKVDELYCLVRNVSSLPLFSSVAGNGSFEGAGPGFCMGQPHSALIADQFVARRYYSSAIVSVDAPFSPATSPYFLCGGGSGKYGEIMLFSTNVSLLRKMDCNSLTT